MTMTQPHLRSADLGLLDVPKANKQPYMDVAFGCLYPLKLSPSDD